MPRLPERRYLERTQASYGAFYLDSHSPKFGPSWR